MYIMGFGSARSKCFHRYDADSADKPRISTLPSSRVVFDNLSENRGVLQNSLSVYQNSSNEEHYPFYLQNMTAVCKSRILFRTKTMNIKWVQI